MSQGKHKHFVKKVDRKPWRDLEEDGVSQNKRPRRLGIYCHPGCESEPGKVEVSMSERSTRVSHGTEVYGKYLTYKGLNIEGEKV